MATKLTRRVIRETSTVAGARPIMLMLEVGGRVIRLKEKGRRRWFTVDIGSVFRLAVRAELGADKLKRRQERQAKRGTP